MPGRDGDRSATVASFQRHLRAAFTERLGGEECYCVPYAHLVAFYGRAGFEVVPPGGGPPFLRERVERYRSRGLDVTLMRRSPSSEPA